MCIQEEKKLHRLLHYIIKCLTYTVSSFSIQGFGRRTPLFHHDTFPLQGPLSVNNSIRRYGVRIKEWLKIKFLLIFLPNMRLRRTTIRAFFNKLFKGIYNTTLLSVSGQMFNLRTVRDFFFMALFSTYIIIFTVSIAGQIKNLFLISKSAERTALKLYILSTVGLT